MLSPLHSHEIYLSAPPTPAPLPGANPKRQESVEETPRRSTVDRLFAPDQVDISRKAKGEIKEVGGSRQPASEQDVDEIQPSDELTDAEKKQVRELKNRDREVRTHEQAHKAAAGNLATGGPSYSYQTGPDGVRYAVGGEVGIQLRTGRTPEETIRLARQAQSAALSPAQPSSQDRKVAADAARRATEATAELQNSKSGEEEDEEESTILGIALTAYGESKGQEGHNRNRDGSTPSEARSPLDLLA